VTRIGRITHDNAETVPTAANRGVHVVVPRETQHRLNVLGVVAVSCRLRADVVELKEIRLPGEVIAGITGKYDITPN